MTTETESMEGEKVMERMEALRLAGLDIRYAARSDAAEYGYVHPVETRDVPFDGALTYVDCGRIARDEDSLGQASTLDRSNYRSLRRDFPDMWTDIHYSNGRALGAFVVDLSDYAVEILCQLSAEYPVYDESDMSEIESEEISAAWSDYLHHDIHRELSSVERDVWEALSFTSASVEALRVAFYGAMHESDYYPEHDGRDVRWDWRTVTLCARQAMADVLRSDRAEAFAIAVAALSDSTRYRYSGRTLDSHESAEVAAYVRRVLMFSRPNRAQDH